MTLKLIGALLIVFGCGGFGFRIASAQKREEKFLRQLISVLDYISCELQYRQTPLPQLCRQSAVECSGMLHKIILSFAAELDQQVSPDVELCMKAALAQFNDLSKNAYDTMRMLGRSLGRFDLEGQLKDIESVRQECGRRICTYSENRDVRLRTYQTLGLCAGAAIAILFI